MGEEKDGYSKMDYREIGGRIRLARQRKSITQERLAELCGVGTPHISHIETGNTIPSLKIFVAIVNALGCSADELLCLELKNAKPVLAGRIAQTLADCSEEELRVISDTVSALKDSLRKQGK